MLRNVHFRFDFDDDSPETRNDIMLNDKRIGLRLIVYIHLYSSCLPICLSARFRYFRD